jgi:hypothetical protein
MASVDFLGETRQASSLTTFTFSSLSFGDAASDRYIFVWIGSSGSNFPLPTVTIGGVTATHLYNVNGNPSLALYGALVPMGTTGNVVVTFSATQSFCSCSVYRLTGLTSLSAMATQFVDVYRLGSAFELSQPAIVLAATWNDNHDSTTFSSNLTKNFDAKVSGNIGYALASSIVPYSTPGYEVSAFVNSGFNARIRFVVFPVFTDFSISGTATINSIPIEGARVRCIDQDSGIAFGFTETDSDGLYTFANLFPDRLYHIAIEYEDGGQRYNAPSLWDIVPVSS